MPVKKKNKKRTVRTNITVKKKNKKRTVRTNINYEQVESLARENLSDKEIAERLRVNYNLFAKRKERDDKLKRSLKSGRKYLSAVFSGRKTEYKPEFAQEMMEYFDVPPYKTVRVGKKTVTVVNDLPLLSGFAVKVGVHRETLQEWSKEFEEFGIAYKLCLEIQDRNLITNGLRGLYSPYANLLSKNLLGFQDKHDVTTKGKEVKVSSTVYVIPGFKEEEE